MSIQPPAGFWGHVKHPGAKVYLQCKEGPAARDEAIEALKQYAADGHTYQPLGLAPRASKAAMVMVSDGGRRKSIMPAHRSFTGPGGAEEGPLDRMSNKVPETSYVTENIMFMRFNRFDRQDAWTCVLELCVDDGFGAGAPSVPMCARSDLLSASLPSTASTIVASRRQSDSGRASTVTGWSEGGDASAGEARRRRRRARLLAMGILRQRFFA